jgi:glycosyltransferase involved in cell wall biosynthesis
MKKILVWISTNHISGPLRQLLQLIINVQLISNYRYHICFDCIKNAPKPTFLQHIRKLGIDYSLLNQGSRFDFSLIREAVKLAKFNEIKILQTHGYKPSIIGCIIKYYLGLPWVPFLHGDTSEDFKVRCYFQLEKFFVRRADAIITVSEAQRQEMLCRGFSSHKVHAVRNAIDPSLFDEVSAEYASRDFLRPHGLNGDGPLIGIIGRMSPEKGHSVFLEAFPRVLTKVPNAKAVFLGTGQEEGRLRSICAEKGLQNHVHFIGFRENIATWYPVFDLVVLPSLSEGLPNVAMEAMLFSKPIVATAVGGVPEVVEDAVTGRLVPARKATELADAIVDVMSNPRLMAEYGGRGRKKVLEEFSPQIRAKSMIAVYDAILSKNVK